MADIDVLAGQAAAAEANPPAPEPQAQEGYTDPLDKFDGGDPNRFKAVDTTKPETVETVEAATKPETTPEAVPESEAKLLAGKYKTQEDLEKGYIELQKKIGSFQGAPETYTLENVNSGDQEKFIEDDENLLNFMKLAKESNMSQEMFDKTLSMYREAIMSMLPKVEEEHARIGKDADLKLRSLKMWADGHLSTEGKERFKNFFGDKIDNADLFLLIDEIRSEMAPVEGPTKFEAAKTAQKTLDDIKREIAANFKRYEDDPHYREEKRQQMKEALEYKKRHG